MRTLIRVLLAVALLLPLLPRPAEAADPFVTFGFLALSTTSEETIVRGTAPRGSIVDLYDNDEMVARVVAMADMDVWRTLLPISVGEHRLVAHVEGTTATARTLLFRTSATFTDIDVHWARTDIEIMATMGVINGMGDGSFGPELNLTRAQFAKLLVLGLQQQPSAADLPSFVDGDRIPDWARGYVGTAVQLGLIRGYEDNTFRPDSPVTRAEVAVMAARALRFKLSRDIGWQAPATGALNFADAAAIPGWAAADVEYVVGAKVVEAYWGSAFDAAQPATRALAAAVVRRIWTLGAR